MTAFQHRDFVETWFRRVWHEEDANAIAEMMVSDAHVKGMSRQVVVGAEGFTAFQQALLALLADVRIEIDRYSEDGDWVTVLFNIRSTCRKTGTTAEFTAQAIARIEDGRIAEAYNHVDFISMFEQLGMMPEGSFQTLLSGHQLK